MEDAFRELHGHTLNFNSMVQAVGKLNRWYEEKGVLGQVRARGQGSAVQCRAVLGTGVCSAVQCCSSAERGVCCELPGQAFRAC